MYQGVPPQVDSTFLKKLREFDDKLFVRFDRVSEKFYILRKKTVGPAAAVLVVETPEKAFRQPDDRDIAKLYWGDLWRHGGVDEHVRRGEQKMLDYHRKLEMDAEEELRYATRENKIQLSNIYRKAYNLGSKSPELRRVNVKGPGKTIEEIKASRAAGRDPFSKVSKAA